MHETLTLADRLRLLLDLAERLALPLAPATELVSPPKRKGESRD